MALLMVLFSSASCGGDRMVIDGTAPEVFDGYNVYLVPRPYPKESEVDSTVIRHGRFRFSVPADSVRICHISISRKANHPYEVLLVAIEKGTLEARLDTTSFCHGTPLNEVIQSWKEKMSDCGDKAFAVTMMMNSTSDPQANAMLSAMRDSIYRSANQFTYRLILDNPNPVGGFIYFSNRHAFDSLETAEILNRVGEWVPKLPQEHEE